MGTVPREGLGPGDPGTESGITREAEGGSSRIKDWKFLELSGDRLRTLLTSLKMQHKKLSSDSTISPGNRVFSGQRISGA